MIPKRIIYCWFGGKPKPESVVNCMNTWKEHMPDWEYLEINETNFDIHFNKYVEEAYENKAGAFVSDVARLWALYHYGGVYMDTDVIVYQSLEKFLNHEFFTGFEQPHYCSTATMGATKSNGLIKEMLDIYDTKTFELRENWQEYETNTMIMSDIIGKYIDRDKMEYQKVDGIVVYPRETFCRSDKQTDEVYTKHLMFGSWVEPDNIQVIIMCGGNYSIFEKHKALSKIRGEVLIERTIRLLKENGITNWFISTNNPDFDKYGHILHHNNNFIDDDGKLTGYWVDAYYPTDKPTIYLHGDVYYTDEAIKRIINLNPKVNTLIGNEVARNKEHLNWGEPFGFIVVDQKLFRKAIDKCKILEDMGMIERECATSWEVYRVLYGLDVNKMYILDDSYLSINDKTIDVDFPDQIELINKGLR